MDVVGKKVETQVQFWSLLGPFFVLLSIAVLLFKVSTHWYFPVSALVGIPLCVKWKMRGMAAALCCLFLLAGVGYQNLDLDDRYWHVGLSMAMAFSFIVLTLSLEEVEGLVCKLQLESQSRLDNFLLLDEKWKDAEREWLCEREKSKGETGSLAQELAKTQEDKQTFYKLAQLAKDELVHVRGQHDLLLQDLLYKKQQIAQLHERLEETEMTIQGFVNSDAEKQILALTERVADLEQEKETFQAKMAIVSEEGEKCLLEKGNLQQELQACQEREKEYFQEKEEQQNAVQALQSKCAWMEQEREKLLPVQAQLQQQYEQNKNSFEQLKQQLEEENQRVLAGVQEQLEIKNAALTQVQERMHGLSMDLQEQQSLVKRSAEQNQRLENLKTQLEHVLQETQEQLQKMKQKQEESHHFNEKLLPAPGNTRQVESMYLQLQEQFQEKSDVLDATRRELFHANEELLKYKREYEEEHVFNPSVTESRLQRYVVRLGREFEQMQKRYQQEVDELIQLVGDLLQQMQILKDLKDKRT